MKNIPVPLMNQQKITIQVIFITITLATDYDKYLFIDCQSYFSFTTHIILILNQLIVTHLRIQGT